MDGENHFIIAPHPGGHFDFAEFSYDSVYGTVFCRWDKKDDGEYSYHIEVPANTDAKVILTGREGLEVGPGKADF